MKYAGILSFCKLFLGWVYGQFVKSNLLSMELEYVMAYMFMSGAAPGRSLMENVIFIIEICTKS